MMEPIRVLIVDDEPIALEGLRRLLATDPELQLVGESTDGLDAVALIERLDPDLVFLDIQMAGLDGLGVVRQIGPDQMPTVVFVTAFDRHAIDAFEVHAIDYVLKPFEDARFRAALAHAKTVVRDGAFADRARRMARALGDDAEPPPETNRLTTIAVRKTDRTVFVPVDTIDWIEAADYCVKLHVDGRAHVIRDAMHRLEGRLDPERFFRCHRSAIVNLDRVREVIAAAGGDPILALADGSRIKLSRVRRQALEARLTGARPSS